MAVQLERFITRGGKTFCYDPKRIYPEIAFQVMMREIINGAKILETTNEKVITQNPFKSDEICAIIFRGSNDEMLFLREMADYCQFAWSAYKDEIIDYVTYLILNMSPIEQSFGLEKTLPSLIGKAIMKIIIMISKNVISKKEIQESIKRSEAEIIAALNLCEKNSKPFSVNLKSLSG